MKIQEVVNRAVTDPKFAAVLQQNANEAMLAGKDTDAWESLMVHFAEDPAELACLRTLKIEGVHGSPAQALDKTWLTLTTFTSAACLCTTTTTTTIW